MGRRDSSPDRSAHNIRTDPCDRAPCESYGSVPGNPDAPRGPVERIRGKKKRVRVHTGAYGYYQLLCHGHSWDTYMAPVACIRYTGIWHLWHIWRHSKGNTRRIRLTHGLAGRKTVQTTSIHVVLHACSPNHPSLAPSAHRSVSFLAA